MCGSCARSCALPSKWRELGRSNARHPTLASRLPQKQAERSSSRSPSRRDPSQAQKSAQHRKSVNRRRGGWLHRDRRQGLGDALFRQGRARHRRADRDHADRRRRTVCAVCPRDDDPGRYRADANQGPTYASLSIQDGGMQIRRAAATAREALLDRGGARSASRRTSLKCATASSASATAARTFAYAELVGIGSSPSKSTLRRAEGSEGLHDRRHARAATGHSREDLRDVHVRPGCQVARHAARADGPSCGRRRDAGGFDDAACRKIPGYLRAVARATFSRSSRPTNGRPSAHRQRSSRRGPTGQACPTRPQLFEYVRNSKIDRDEVLQSAGDTTRRSRRAAGRFRRPTTSP